MPPNCLRRSAPAKRIAHFQAAWKKLRFMGWQVDVREVKTVDGVTTIVVQAYPLGETKEGMPVDNDTVLLKKPTGWKAES